MLGVATMTTIIQSHFSCACLPLYLDPSSAELTDVDECAEELHSCHPEEEICRNTAGAYECDMRCQDGFHFSPALKSCVGELFPKVQVLYKYVA